MFLGFGSSPTRTMRPRGAHVQMSGRNWIGPHRGGSERPAACTVLMKRMVRVPLSGCHAGDERADERADDPTPPVDDALV